MGFLPILEREDPPLQAGCIPTYLPFCWAPRLATGFGA